MTDDTGTTITGRIDDHEFGIHYVSPGRRRSHELDTPFTLTYAKPPRGTLSAAADFPRESVRLGDYVDIDISGDTPITHVSNAYVDSHEPGVYPGVDISTTIYFREWVAYGDDFKE